MEINTFLAIHLIVLHAVYWIAIGFGNFLEKKSKNTKKGGQNGQN